MASVGGIRGVLNQTPYVATKHAVSGMIKNAAIEYGSDGITTNAAVQAALSILDDLKDVNDSYFKIHFRENIQVGIGLHIGRVVSGVIRIGEEERMIVMGFPVNVASRLQSATRSLNNSLVVSADI